MGVMTLASAPIKLATWDSLELCVWRNTDAQKHEHHARHRQTADERERRADRRVARFGKLRENEAEPAEGRDERGDDGRAENGDARRIAAVRARLHVTAAARHVVAMPEEVSGHHTDQGED